MWTRFLKLGDGDNNVQNGPDGGRRAVHSSCLFGKWCVRDEIGKVGVRVALYIPDAEIPNDVVKGGRRLLTNDVAKALFESVFES